MLRRPAIALAVVVLALAQLCILAAQSADARTILILKSQPGDWVGDGKRMQRMTPAADSIRARRWPTSDTMHINFDDEPFFSLSLRPPQGQELVPGFYEDAQRASSGSPVKPGLDVSIHPRGCNQLRGRFLISEISIDADGYLQKLAVDFEQHCEYDVPALYGSVRYKSDVPIEPHLSIAGTTALKGNAGTSDATVVASLSMPSTSEVTARVRTRNGTALGGTDYVATSRRIVFPPGVTEIPVIIPIIGNRTPRGDGTFLVTIDSETPIVNDRAQVRILDPNEPKTVLTMNSQRYSYVGADWNETGRAWLITPADTTFAISRNTLAGVGLETGFPARWAMGLTPGDWTTLDVGKYDNVVRWPLDNPGRPSMYVSGEGRACNSVTGGFTVKQAEYAGDGSVEVFAAEFEMRCESQRGMLFGSLNVNAVPHQASVTNAVIDGSTAEFTVTLNPPATRNETVQFTTRDGSARAGSDYDTVFRTLTFARGETEKTVQVPLRAGARAGAWFYAELSSLRTPLWLRYGFADIK